MRQFLLFLLFLAGIYALFFLLFRWERRQNLVREQRAYQIAMPLLALLYALVLNVFLDDISTLVLRFLQWLASLASFLEFLTSAASGFFMILMNVLLMMLHPDQETVHAIAREAVDQICSVISEYIGPIL